MINLDIFVLKWDIYDVYNVLRKLAAKTHSLKKHSKNVLKFLFKKRVKFTLLEQNQLQSDNIFA